VHSSFSPRPERVLSSHDNGVSGLGDFTTTPRVIPIALLAIGIGGVATLVAAALLKLIAFFTNLFFFQRFGVGPQSPAHHQLGGFVVLVPVAGALVVGLMARYGSERIRGHGIPEAIESILINGSKIEPKVALLKPLSAAISIGSGGPFGAEGPIIMTGGAVGSLIAQFFHLTSAERKTLLVAGAAAGMSATFAAPVASVTLAIELLLFELKPRSAVPVALASATAGILRQYVLGPGPLFPVPAQPGFVGPATLAGCVLAGMLAGALSALLTGAVYASEDAFQKLPIHWMWWPAIGGLVIGIGGLIFPQALGVGYETIGALLQGGTPAKILLGILLVKSVIWSVSLGSGTSGGVVAPLLMMGGALGGLEALAWPAASPGFWPLISMGAILGGTMRAPLTGIVFAVELTHEINVLLPLLVAVTIAHAFTVLVLKRSILTEKVSRRGYHLSREYATDPLEIIFVREVVRTSVLAIPSDMSRARVSEHLLRAPVIQRQQRLYPIVDPDLRLLGVVRRSDLLEWVRTTDNPEATLASSRLYHAAIVAHGDESLRVIVYRMAETGFTRFPVVDRESRLQGMVTLSDLLAARTRTLEAEQRRERVLRPRLRLPWVGAGSTGT
jgi:CIC family chloride channel protein